MHSQAFVSQINVRITEQQLLWLESQVKPFRNKSAVIRDLIEMARQRLEGGASLSAYHVGAGPPQGNVRPLTGNKPSLKQPENEAEITESQQLPPHQTEAVPSTAQEPDHKKEYIVVKNDIKKTKGTPEFEAFWKRYQGCRHRANGQSKPKALDVWCQLVPDELQPDDLMRAVDGAIADIRSRQSINEFASPLPDCFRWLRDACYAVYLEDNTPEPTKSSMFLV
jgi:Arc/MetJ-type ribon-helix-helix transcriptional regulator